MSSQPLLSLAVWIPIIGGLAVMLVGWLGGSSKARFVSLLSAIVGCLVTIPLWTGFNLGEP